MAVYTEISDEELAQYLKQYDIGEMHSLKGIAEGVENSNYLLTTDKGPYILTLYEKRVDANDLPFFLGLKEHLAKTGINCPRPIPMKSGKFLGELSGRPSAIISFLDGISVSRPKVEHCVQLGKALAELHEAGQGFEIKRPNSLSYKSWRPLYESAGPNIDDQFKGLPQLIESELEFLENNWPEGLPSGVIHADLFTDNVFFLKDELSGLIDFYFACNDLYVYDLAICLNAWCFENDLQFNVTKAKALIKGYQSKRPLLAGEIDVLPLMCRGSSLRFLLTRLYDWLNVPEGALVKPKDPDEFIAKLKFHRSIKSAAEYGLEQI